jgi:hypothetical protein
MICRAASRFRIASVGVLFGVAAAFLLAAGPADAQAIIKVSDTAFVRFGFILQPQADWQQLASSTDTTGYQQNLFIRRARFLLGARLAKDVYLYMDTENSNLGKATTSAKALGTGFQLLTMFGEWRIDDAFMLEGGLIRVPYSREALKAAGSQFALDVSAYNYLQQTSVGATGGNRDTGFEARGYLLDHRLDYRIGAFQGVRLTGSHNPFRVAGFLQYNFLDREDMYNPGTVYSTSLPGSYLGDKKVLAVGGGFDTQMNYRYYSGHLFASIPAGPGAIEGTFQYQYLNGGVTFTALPPENTEQVDLGYYIKALKIAPLVRYEQRIYNGQEAKNEARFGAGLNYYPYKFNFNIKGMWIRVDPKTGPAVNEFTIQLQFYYF